MQIKVACSCGQHYEFEVEPQNGAMPCNVVCPACGADGTQAANQYITQQTSDVAAAAVPPAPAPSGLRISRPATSPAEPEPLSAPAAAAAPPPTQKRFTRALEPDREPPKSEANVPMGILGGVIAGGIAMAGWYFLTLATDRQFGFVAWIIGAFVGMGVRILAREGTPMLGYAAAVCAAVAILGGNFLVVNHIVDKVQAGFQEGFARGWETEQRKFAQEAVSAKTDDQVKAWLVKNGDLEHSPTQQDIKEFREKTVPEMQALLDKKNDPKSSDDLPHPNRISFSQKFAIFRNNLGVLNYLFLFFGVASAWRIGSGHD